MFTHFADTEGHPWHNSAPSMARGFLIRTGWQARLSVAALRGGQIFSAPRNRLRRGMSATAEPALVAHGGAESERLNQACFLRRG
jgi:hypothetical protein